MGTKTLDVHQHPFPGSRQKGGEEEGVALNLEGSGIEVIVDPLTKKKADIVSCFLKLFPRLVPEGIQVEGSWDLPPCPAGVEEPPASGEREDKLLEVFKSACHLLTLVSQLGGEEADVEGKIWRLGQQPYITPFAAENPKTLSRIREITSINAFQLQLTHLLHDLKVLDSFSLAYNLGLYQ